MTSQASVPVTAVDHDRRRSLAILVPIVMDLDRTRQIYRKVNPLLIHF